MGYLDAQDDDDEEGMASPQMPAMAPPPSGMPPSMPPGLPTDMQAPPPSGGTELSDDKRRALQQYIADKYGIGTQYSPDARKKLEDQNAQEDSGINWKAGLAALGAGLSGHDAGAAGTNVLNMQKAAREGRLADFDKRRAVAIQAKDMEESDAKKKRETDPSSDESKMAQSLATRMGMDPAAAATLTAAKFKDFSPALEKAYQIEEDSRRRAEDRDDKKVARGERAEDRQMQRDQMKQHQDDVTSEKMQALKTPFGLANTVDDAKQLKEAYESKKNFDSKIDQMITLREKHKGGTNSLINSEDVDRGKQLSKDLLLEYKNMAKLGVLSKSDEDIINAIIPKDPLSYNGIASTVTGQDPILNNLKQFRQDSSNDFNTKVATRTRDGGTGMKAMAGNQAPPMTGKPKVEHVDNNTKLVNGVKMKKVPGGWEEVTDDTATMAGK